MTKPVLVKYVGSNLVASFSRATTPLVWTFDLDRNHSFTLSLRGEGENWELGVTSFKGEFDVVATFQHKEDAELAFQKIQKALMKRRRTWLGRIGRGLLYLVLTGIILVVAFIIFQKYAIEHAMMNLPMLPPVHPPAEMQDGIPLPADDVLKPPS